MILIHGLDIIAIKKELRVAKISLAAKAVALSEDFDNAFYIAKLYSEILNSNSNNNVLPKVYTDKKSLIDAIQLTKYVNNSRLIIDISAVKVIILEKHVSKVEWLPSIKQLTNSLTKQEACAMSRLLCYRRVNYNTEGQDPPRKTLDTRRVYFSESPFLFEFRTFFISATFNII